MLKSIKYEIDMGNIHKDKIEFIEIAAQVERKSFFKVIIKFCVG